MSKIVGAVAGAAIGFITGGPVGAIRGAIGGYVLIDALTSKKQNSLS
jgi:outer membrane lipoprotein SlyB